jgi:hypothetical protein
MMILWGCCLLAYATLIAVWFPWYLRITDMPLDAVRPQNSAQAASRGDYDSALSLARTIDRRLRREIQTMIITVDGITINTVARTATEGDVTLVLHPDFVLPNLPGEPGYDETFTSGWQPEDADADDSWLDGEDAANSEADDLDAEDDLIPGLASLEAFLLGSTP